MELIYIYIYVYIYIHIYIDIELLFELCILFMFYDKYIQISGVYLCNYLSGFCRFCYEIILFVYLGSCPRSLTVGYWLPYNTPPKKKHNCFSVK